MKAKLFQFFLLFSISINLAFTENKVNMPYRELGLTERQAAAHLLDRFTFGPRIGDVDRVVEMGLENWFISQLNGNLDDAILERRLQPLKTLEMSAGEIASTYLGFGMILNMARREGIIDSMDLTGDRGELRKIVMSIYEKKGYRSQRELIGQMLTQKVYRAVYSQNQLTELLTDFWFNHFNVSITDNQCSGYVLSYERDAIRPNVFGEFKNLLEATAKHPAMLLYLDNAQSSAAEGIKTTMAYNMDQFREQRGRRSNNRFNRQPNRQQNEMQQSNNNQRRRRRGLNENYARELMELHTLGVDGGYTQEDVVEVARAFTGWTVFPPGQRREQMNRRLERGKRVGFIQQGEFLFRADAHDATEKTILGEKFSAGGGMDEGERILGLLSKHPATARHISRKIATYFVSDNPPEALVDRLCETYLETDGNTRELLITLVESPEFWDKSVRRSKIKSPFQLAISAIRALDAEIWRPRQLIEQISKMGQPLYAYQAPTGYPDKAEAWVNTGSLLNRMNFGLALAMGEIRGINFDLAGLNQNREPESVEAALERYANLLLPERDLTETLRLLKPMVANPQLAEKVSQSANQSRVHSKKSEEQFEMEERKTNIAEKNKSTKKESKKQLAQVVGIILGSPEFQRR